MEDKDLKNLKRREFKVEDEDGNIIGDLIDVAVVTDPAIELNTQFFSKAVKKEKFKIADERQEITGPIMVPNKDILRYDEKNEEYYYCFFTEDTVRKCLQLYMESCSHIGSKPEHLGLKNDKMFTFESWIVEDPQNDKSNALGWKDIPKGSWFGSIKVKDSELWNYLKENEFKGFSIEGSFGIFNYKPVQIKNQAEEILPENELDEIEKIIEESPSINIKGKYTLLYNLLRDIVFNDKIEDEAKYRLIRKILNKI